MPLNLGGFKVLYKMLSSFKTPVSLSTIKRVLKTHKMSVNELHWVSFKRNSDSVKELEYLFEQVRSVVTCIFPKS